MADLDTRLALIEHQLNQILTVSEETRSDVRTLHDEHRGLALEVAKIPMSNLEDGEKRFAPRGRFETLEKTFYALVVALLAGGAGLALKGQFSGEHAASAAVPQPAPVAIEEQWRRPVHPGVELSDHLAGS